MRLCLTFLRAFQARNQTPIASNALVNHARRVYPAQFKRSFLTTEMKRQAIKDPAGAPKAKKAREEEPAYHLTPSVKDELGEIVWPARGNEMENARKIIIECAESKQRTLIVPDKDADGLTSGMILYKTLVLLGLPAELITAHFLEKGETVHSVSESERMASSDPAYIFVLDQGSRASDSLISKPHTALVIDHHHATEDDFPKDAHHVNASAYPPVATSSLLTYEICKPLHAAVASQTAWLCCIGTQGDLGSSIIWGPPFPDMSATHKQYTKKAINDAVSMLNAPRRTATFDVKTAWDALLKASESDGGPKAVARDPRLQEARAEINAEVERCTHTAPKFSKDGRVAVFRINSEAQVHPLIATRWANHLNSKALEVVMCANSGHLPDKVNFSCRVSRMARARRSAAGEEDVNIIEMLKEYAKQHESGDLIDRMGESFARGHRQASGGIVAAREFEDLMSVMRVGEKPDPKPGEEGKSPAKKKANGGTPQKNTLANYFGKK